MFLASPRTRRTWIVLRATVLSTATMLSARAHGAEPEPVRATCSKEAKPPEKPCEQDKPKGPRRALGITTSFVPGLIVHGSGHIVAGQTRTGLVLLGAEGVGVGLAIGGLAGTAATGATRRFIAPMVLGLVAGGALLIIPALADIYGMLAPEGGTGSPPKVLPGIETQLGLAYVYDPNFAYRFFLTSGVDFRIRSFRFSGSGYWGLDDTNSRSRAAIAYRFFGPGPKGILIAADGSFLDLEVALTRHDYASDGFSVTTGELNLSGRLDLVRVGPTLKGSFAELGFGFAYAAHSYANLDVEVSDLLTPRFAFGMYLGHSGYPRGEVSAYYDHRHDGFAGGLKSRGLGSGIAGHFGVNGRIYASPRWGMAFDATAGSAFVGQASLLFRYGGNP